MNASTAFVSSFAPSLTFLSSTPATMQVSRTFIATPRMALETKDKTDTAQSPFRSLEANRAAKAESEYRGPQGFTPYAEKVNGRLAQLGFVIGLVTEIVSGKGINEQILIMFSPLVHLLQNVAGTTL
eukprot:TRINITY_DN1284_c0_g2_i1.p4 TRINITY_DN1284_c0_g2~~TRINITY_DN1284_c0_g2_i1.p4  ORF type:complete len:127 (+),score=18.19 TRINITY_DN1284_c0_g2_i1:646-1026(+)